jgi:hypothetical protein
MMARTVVDTPYGNAVITFYKHRAPVVELKEDYHTVESRAGLQCSQRVLDAAYPVICANAFDRLSEVAAAKAIAMRNHAALGGFVMGVFTATLFIWSVWCLLAYLKG